MRSCQQEILTKDRYKSELKSQMDFFKGLGKFFAGNNQQQQKPSMPQTQSRLKGKVINNYELQNLIVHFTSPQTELVKALHQSTNKKCSVYALQKTILTQEAFVMYQNSLANNCSQIYPQYIQHMQSSSFIYIVLEELSTMQSMNWMADDLLDQIQSFSMRVKQKIRLDGILVNNKKKIVYLPQYQDTSKISKLYYEGINKTLYAELFCKVFDLPETSRQKVFNKIVQFAESNQLKSQVLKVLSATQKKPSYNKQPYQAAMMLNKPQQSKSFMQNPQKKSAFQHPSQINAKTQKSLYPDLTAQDEQIMKLISVVKVNPKLFQNDSISNLRASTRAKHQNQEQTKQIKNVIDNAKQSLFEINKVVKKSSLKSNINTKNQNDVSDNTFQVYCTTYISIFTHFKRTVKSSLAFYSKGFSGIINAYFITLIGILRRSQLVYALNYQDDVFQIGCDSVNVQFYSGKLKKQLVSQAKILTDLRQMILRCYIPIKTMQILQPFLDDHIQNIDLTKLEDFCFFYMTSLMKNNFQKDIHFINAIEFMYIILHRNFQIVHFESDMPKKWDDDFFFIRKQLIASMIPDWNF